MPAKRKKLTEKQLIIKDIVSALNKCPIEQLMVMYEVMGMAAETALQLTRAEQQTGRELAIKVAIEENGLPGGQQSELKS